MKNVKNKIVSAGMLAVLSVSTIGCGTASNEKQPVAETQTIEMEDTINKKIVDNNTLYANDDDTSVVTMYLTVSKGNESENTNHTWEEVNSYSVYDYEEMGVERYGVEGLLQVGDQDGPTSGSLGYGINVPNATVTIRGQSSSENTQKNYKINIKDGKGEWNNQRVINLNKHQTDGVRFRNKLCYDLMERIDGMISMQTQFVHLYVKDTTEGNGTKFVDYGLYTQVEQPNKSFLERHGLDKNGQLYKLNFFEFNEYSDVIKLRNDADYDKEAFEELLEIKGDNDHSKLIDMLKDLNDYSIRIEDVINTWFEEDNLLSWLAFHILTGNDDTQSRNAMIYSPKNINTWYFISWDCDASFRAKEREILLKDQQAGWESGVSNYWGNTLFNRLLKSSAYREKLDKKIEEYKEVLSKETIQSLVDSYSEVTKEYAYKGADITYAPLTKTQYDQVCNAIPNEVEKNYELYKESMENPMPFFIGTPAAENGKTKFVWENSYDFAAQDLHYSIEVADNLEFKDPVIKEENLFTPEYTYSKTLKQGQYFVRVKVRNESGKEQTAFDYYVIKDSIKIYGVKCIYVNADGSIVEDVYGN
ncbi:MAG: CotH kinase family protein [bacterium]|nr:CotH kinase family protein [bacterium]